MIAERGFANTTIRGIAEEEGLAVGTVMAHFGSKEDLLFEVFYEDLEELVARGLAAAGRKRRLAARLYALAETVLRGLAERPDIYAELMRRGLFARGVWGERFEQQVRRTAMAVAQWYRAEQPELAPDRLQSIVSSYFALYYFTLLQLVKEDFAGLEQGLASLRSMVELHVGGWR